MKLKKALIKFVEFYQYFISPALGNNCRYYPTCSEYTKIEFETSDNLVYAFFKSVKRVLKCNQFFKGGIDYPVVYKQIKTKMYKKESVKYWLVPLEKGKFIVIKANNGK
jgi:putative membrane protein insertion efficiency factor